MFCWIRNSAITPPHHFLYAAKEQCRDSYCWLLVDGLGWFIEFLLSLSARESTPTVSTRSIWLPFIVCVFYPHPSGGKKETTASVCYQRVKLVVQWRVKRVHRLAEKIFALFACLLNLDQKFIPFPFFVALRLVSSDSMGVCIIYHRPFKPTNAPIVSTPQNGANAL